MRVRTLLATATSLAIASLAAGFGLTAASADVVEPFTLRYDKTGYGDFLTIGNTVLECPSATTADRCGQAEQTGSANNNVFVMRRTNTAKELTGTYDSSTGQVTVPAGAKVAYARLFWGGHNGEYGSGRSDRCELRGAAGGRPEGDPLTTKPVISVDGAPQAEVTPQNASETPGNQAGPHYYTAEGDVTGAFADVTTGTPVSVAVGNVYAVESLGCSAGWSLTLVYQYDEANPQYAPERRSVHIWGGNVQQLARTPQTNVDVSGFYMTGDAPARASLTVFEGDPKQAGDQFHVNGTNVPAPAVDQSTLTQAASAIRPLAGETDNFFNSQTNGALDPSFPHNLSVDAKQFDLPAGVITAGDTSAQLSFLTNGDAYVASQLALSVPVPDVVVTKEASAKQVAPGDDVTFTLTATNRSSVDFPGAEISDDLSDVIDDATFDGSADASSGTVSYDEPTLSWTGDLPAGATVTVKYTVTVGDPAPGNQEMKNVVILADSVPSNCGPETQGEDEDPTCGQTITIAEPAPSPSPTPTATTNPTPEPPGGPGPGPGEPGESLPRTGAGNLLPIGLGAVALGALGVLLLLARRRRTVQ